MDFHLTLGILVLRAHVWEEDVLREREQVWVHVRFAGVCIESHPGQLLRQRENQHRANTQERENLHVHPRVPESLPPHR